MPRLAALKTATIAELKDQWRSLFAAEPPPYNRRFLESRLAYRIQELAYGGLTPATLERLEALGEQLDGGNVVLRRIRHDDKPIAGTRLIREYRGIEHCVTVRQEGYEYQGRPYGALSAIARAITRLDSRTRGVGHEAHVAVSWCHAGNRQEAPLRRLHTQVDGGGAGHELQLA